MSIFRESFLKSLNETNLAGIGGVFGDAPSMNHGGAVSPTGDKADFYASKDGRDIMNSEGGKKKKKRGDKKKKVKKRDVGVDMLMPVQRRPLIRGL